MFNKPDTQVAQAGFQYIDVADIAPASGWILLYYGGSATGKTWFCGTAGPRTLFINIGNGFETLSASPLFRMKHPEFFGLNGAKGAVVVNLNEKFSSTGDINVATAFDLVCRVVDDALVRPEIRDRFDTIVIDDATSLRRFALNRAIEIQDSPQSRTKRRLNRYVMTDMSDKGREIDMMNWFLAQYTPEFKNQGINLIMTAHERQIYGATQKMGEERPLKAIKPAFTGQTFPDDVPAFFDEVWRAEPIAAANGTVFRCWTQHNGIHTCKSRHGGIFKELEQSPHHARMLARIKEGKMVEQDAGSRFGK